MLPPQLTGLYRQYKEDTDSVAAWLASTAKSCGYPADLLASQTWDVLEARHPTVGRLKGKARKQALNANSEKSTTELKTKTYAVAIKDFLPLAHFIAGRQNPAISVPPAFGTTVDRLIKLRSGFDGKMEAHGATPSPQASVKQENFLSVLQEVREALLLRMSPRPDQEPASKSTASGHIPPQDTAHDLGSRFASLSVDEPSPELIESFVEADPQRPKPQKEDLVTYKAAPQTSNADMVSAFLILTRDLNEIRARIDWIWSTHFKGLFDIATAAVSTNVAISFARGLIDDLAPILERYDGGPNDLIESSFIAYCMRKGYTPEDFKSTEGHPFNMDLYDIATDMYVVSATLMNSCLIVLDPDRLPLCKEGSLGTYDASSDRNRKSGSEKFIEDWILIVQFFSELMVVIRLLPDYPVEDEFLRSMRELDRTGKVSLTAIFAAQIFLDIHHIMRYQTRRTFRAVMQETRAMEKHIQSHFEFHQNLEINTWHPSNDVHIRDVVRLVQWMEDDPVYKIKVEQFEYLFDMRHRMYNMGLAVAGAWGSIDSSVHLYNAVANDCLPHERRWQDMDALMTILDNESFWVGGERPKTPADCFKKFSLHMGISAAVFTQKRRLDEALTSRVRPCGLKKDGLPVSRMFRGIFVRGVDPEWTQGMIQDIVVRTRYPLEEPGDRSLLFEQIVDAQESEDKETERSSAAKKKKKKRGGKSKTGGSAAEDAVAPGDLVKDLSFALDGEKLEAAFPYLLMHKWCWKLLRRVKDHCDPILRQLHGPEYMNRENQLSWIVGYILADYSGGETGIPDRRLIEAAAEAFKGMIASGSGDVVLSVLREKNGISVEFAVE